MKLNRVLIINKPSGMARKPNLCAGHAAALTLIKRELSLMGIKSRVASRFNIPSVRNFDLVISFGGDGTFLAAAHRAGSVPILGINAAPDHSVGFYCAATPANFGLILTRIMSGKMKPKQAPLIEAWVGAKRLPCLALNDVLFTGSSPAETVRYEIAARGKSEAQKSSGVWISAGPGSSAAISSAGGAPMPRFSRKLQFLVREPCPRPGSRYRMTRSILPEGGRVSIIPHIRTAKVYIDGHWQQYAVKQGAMLTCRVSRQTLNLFV